MVHLVLQRETLYTGWVSPATQTRIEYTLEVLFLVGSLMFVWGTVYFFPGPNEDLRTGCRIFDAASVLFALLALYATTEMWWFRYKMLRPVPRREILEQALFFFGSIIFLVGTLIWDPDLLAVFVGWGGSEYAWKVAGCTLFMLGSFMFAFAAYINALSLHHVHPLFFNYALSITTCYEFGGLAFVAGTTAFIPGMNCDHAMEWCGSFAYLFGSFCYVAGSLLSLLKTVARNRLMFEQQRAAARIQHRWQDRQDQRERDQAARQIQHVYHERYQQRLDAAAVLQQTLRRRLQAKRETQQEAALRIQRAWAQHTQHQEDTDAATVIQDFWKKYLEARHQTDSEDEAEDARCEQELMRQLSGLSLAEEEPASLPSLLWRALFGEPEPEDRSTPLVER